MPRERGRRGRSSAIYPAGPSVRSTRPRRDPLRHLRGQNNSARRRIADPDRTWTRLKGRWIVQLRWGLLRGRRRAPEPEVHELAGRVRVQNPNDVVLAERAADETYLTRFPFVNNCAILESKERRTRAACQCFPWDADTTVKATDTTLGTSV